MNALRTHRMLARLVLAWFVLFVGVSVASPIVQPSATQLICSASGAMKLVATDGVDGDGVTQSGMAGMDCPLCSPMALALPTPERTADAPSSLAHALRPTTAALLSELTRLPLSARGPPSLS